jgi:hypothetical protein
MHKNWNNTSNIIRQRALDMMDNNVAVDNWQHDHSSPHRLKLLAACFTHRWLCFADTSGLKIPIPYGTMSNGWATVSHGDKAIQIFLSICKIIPKSHVNVRNFLHLLYDGFSFFNPWSCSIQPCANTIFEHDIFLKHNEDWEASSDLWVVVMSNLKQYHVDVATMIHVECLATCVNGEKQKLSSDF